MKEKIPNFETFLNENARGINRALGSNHPDNLRPLDKEGIDLSKYLDDEEPESNQEGLNDRRYNIITINLPEGVTKLGTVVSIRKVASDILDGVITYKTSGNVEGIEWKIK